MAKEEWRNGWRSLVSATAGISVASFAASSTGIVMEPLNRLYGWPKSVVSAGVLCVAIITLLLAPLNGHLIRNHGPRRVALASLIAAAIGFCCIAMSGGQAWTWWLAWFVFGALTAGVGPIVWTSGITLAFDRHRGAALSIALSGSGLAFFLSPLIGFWLLNNFGWRFVYVGFAVMVIGVHLPLTWFWFRPLSPQGRNSAATDTASGGTSAGLTFVEIVTNPKFVMLALFTMLVASTEGAFMIHLVPILRHTGLAAGQAAEIASILGVAMIIGRLGTGFLFDHWSPIATVVIMVSGLLLSCLVAILLQSSMQSSVAMTILLGLGCGGTTMAMAYLVGRNFDLSCYSSVFGLLMGLFGISYGLAPVLASRLFDMMGSYDQLFRIMAVMLVVAIVIIGSVKQGRPSIA